MSLPNDRFGARWMAWIARPSRAYRTILLGAALLVAGEIVLQVRSHIKTGHSIWGTLVADGPYYTDSYLGARRLKPNRVVAGRDATIHTNSRGFRGGEIPADLAPGELRVAVLGASTVFGAYAKDDSATFPARLETMLRSRVHDRPVNVINAGLVGLIPEQQRKLLEKEILPLSPGWIVWHPGMNNLAEICRAAATPPSGRPAPRPVMAVELPKWVLMYELARKNTAWMRPSPPATSSGAQTPRASEAEDPISKVVQKYDVAGRQIAAAAQASSAKVLFVGNARSFRRDMPAAEQARLSESMRHYYACLDVAALQDLGDRINLAIADAAWATGSVYLDGGGVVPGGDKYFVDASHFTATGEQRMAEAILRVLLEGGIAPAADGSGR